MSIGPAGLEKAAALLSFIAPALIRWVPEARFPYPIGFDTPLYISWGRHYASNPTAFPLMLPLLGGLYTLGLDMVLVMKFLPTLLYGLLGFSVYRFSRFHLGWRSGKCLLAVFLVALSFTSLRVSWDMHKQMMATAFLFLALSWLKSLDKPLGFAAFAIFSFLAAFSHQVVFAVLTVVLSYALLFEAREKPKRALRILIVFSCILLLFIGVWYGWRLDVVLRSGLGSWASDASHLSGMWPLEAEGNISDFLRLCGLMAPLVVLGLFKDRVLSPWLYLGLLGSFSAVLIPFHVPSIAPSRWMLLLGYPLSLFAANALDKLNLLTISSSKKLIALVLVIFIVNAPTWGFLGLSPQPPIFHRANLLPETMASSSIPTGDIEATIWLVRKFDEVKGTALIVHGHYFGWASYYTARKVVTFGELYGGDRTIDEALQLAQSEDFGDVYLLWYLDNDAYSAGFVKFAEKGPMRLYRYAGSGTPAVQVQNPTQTSP